jgi:23S rRNA (guanosine2251-2'-O)-methyltransferase
MHDKNMANIWIWGWHSVESVLKNRSRGVSKIFLLERNISRFEKSLLKYTNEQNLNKCVEIVNQHKMDNMFGGNHQGVAISCTELNPWNLKDWVREQSSKKKSFLVACDHLEDGHNLGAIIRTAAAFNADGLLMTKIRNAPLDGVVAKSAAGALEILPIIKVANLANSLQFLQENEYMVFGLDENGVTDWPKPDRVVIVLGQEGNGLRELTKKTCDAIISINTNKAFSTLNVSVAAGIAISRYLE